MRRGRDGGGRPVVVAGAAPVIVEPSPEVRAALDRGGPLVALETSVLTHGLPEPANRRAAESMDRAVRAGSAVPAWVWTDGGCLRVGASDAALDRILKGGAVKVARRDLPMALATGALGGTTVSATLWAASAAGIEVAATGGIGGVHPGSGDVSADLLELARTPGTLVCSGPKSIHDPGATLERLEELGVGVIGYRTDRLPFFVVRDSGQRLEHRADDAATVAEVARARRELGVRSALVVCNPCPQPFALPPDEVAAAAARCAELARAGGVRGKELTPALLACLAEETGGRTLEANLALLADNAALAARVAVRCAS
jgi:pseudouridine-5'-phosphate glycosidase